jgi:hypothetical protein
MELETVEAITLYRAILIADQIDPVVSGGALTNVKKEFRNSLVRDAIHAENMRLGYVVCRQCGAHIESPFFLGVVKHVSRLGTNSCLNLDVNQSMSLVTDWFTPTWVTGVEEAVRKSSLY